MTDHAQGTLKQMESVQYEDAKRAGLPRRLQNLTPGYHAPAAAEPGSPGWTTYVHALREHPTQRGRFAYPIDQEGKEALAARLPHDVAALVRTSAPLGKDWEPAGLEEAEPIGAEVRM